MSRHIVESTLRGFTRALATAFAAERTAARRGLLQWFDPRARIVSVFLLVVAVTLCRKLDVLAVLFVLATLLAIASQVELGVLVKRVWLVVFAFTGLIALPALFITPGTALERLGPLVITAQGLRTAALLVLRVETAVTLTTTLVLSTHWVQVLRGLRALWIPAEVITMLAMTHRYIFLLIETASQMFESRQSRMVGTLTGTEQRRMAARTAGVLLAKSADLSYEVYSAMESRGFRGDIRLMSHPRMRMHDFSMILMAICVAAAAAWAGR